MNAISRAALPLLLLVAGLAPAAAYDIPEAIYPSLPAAGAGVETFVPEGWTIEVQAEGDLNRDRRPDLLLVLKKEDPANLIVNDPASPGEDEWDANPRILAVAFAGKKGGYELALQSDDFLPRHEDPCIDDPFGMAEISDGNVRVGLHLWANAGTWYTSDSRFTFRYSDKAFRLVAYTDYTTKRNTGETWDLSLDYVARRARMTRGDFTSDEAEDETYERRLPRAPLPTIEEIGSGWDFYPEQSELSWWGLREEGFGPEDE
jgi:hypothetical protein